MSRLGLLFMVFLVVFAFSLQHVSGGENEEIRLWYFWGTGCPLCDAATLWLEELEESFPELAVERLEVFHDQDNLNLFKGMMEARGRKAQMVPTFILGDRVWVGFNDEIIEDILWEVEHRLETPVFGGDEGYSPPPADGRAPGRTISLGRGLTLDLSARSVLVATILIGMVDGINPCSLWVLTVLLAIILNTHTRRRIAVVGSVFLLVTATVYGLFIAGVFAVFGFVIHLAWIRYLIAFLAFGFAALNIADWVLEARDISISIPQRLRPYIYSGGRDVARPRAILPLMGITALFAAGVAIIELPCTAGFPVLWASIVADAGVGGTTFVLLLAVYLLAYLLIEIAIIASALVTMKVSKLQQSHGKDLKLVGGMVMAAIAVMLVAVPKAMETLFGSFSVVAAALLISALLLYGRSARKI